MPKRKLEATGAGAANSPSKKARQVKPPAAVANVADKFRTGLFDDFNGLQKLKEKYAKSKPYKHAVLRNLINDKLLSGVLNEVKTKISFTEKETDIYKIYQSGDLANLDGLDKESAKQLPNLLKLRNALYSAPFRQYLATIAGTGPLSGTKTDMAINIYKPGGHLLCHDDVIGSRRISYILYLTKEWKSVWGGALRLYPTTEKFNSKGHKVHVPSADFSLSIPPAWNQMSFFAVQPGQSYHDVEEVYASGFRSNDDSTPDDDRIRIAISGWFHIPQLGEDGYKPGAEEREAKKSSLAQLKSKDTLWDLPRPRQMPFECYPWLEPVFPEPEGAVIGKRIKPMNVKPMHLEDDDWSLLTEKECDYLLKFMNPHILAPDRLRVLHESFADESAIELQDFLRQDFADLLRSAIEGEKETLSEKSSSIVEDTLWEVAGPPHKRRFLFIPPTAPDPNHESLLSFKVTKTSPIRQLISEYLCSMPFRKWLGFATGLIVRQHDLKARRFRRGLDYQLGTTYTEEQPRLELTLGLSPKGNWEAGAPAEDADEDVAMPDEVRNGGEECWIGGDEEDEEDEAEADADDGSSSLSSGYTTPELSDSDDDTPARARKPAKSRSKPKIKPTPNTSFSSSSASASASAPKTAKSDPAVYKADNPDTDEGVLFAMTAGWNKLSIVVRDRGSMKYVRFVSTAAGADRWDVTGDYEVDWDKTEKTAFFEDEEEGDGAEGDDEENGDGDKAEGGDGEEPEAEDEEEL